jgi:hypothetical protein
MINPWKKNMVILSFLCALGSLILPTHAFASEPKRGDFPACQEECLRKHKHRLDSAWEDYKKTDDRVAYQDRVETAADTYQSCLNNCRIPISVK